MVVFAGRVPGSLQAAVAHFQEEDRAPFWWECSTTQANTPHTHSHTGGPPAPRLKPRPVFV